MIIIANKQTGKLSINGYSFAIRNKVRSLREGTRAASEVIKTLPDNFPYDPQTFPVGRWRITKIEWQKEKGFDYNTYGPVKIFTDAWQWVNVWALDENNDYIRETGQLVKDHGYSVHYSNYTTSWGCILFKSADNAVTVANFIQAELAKGATVELEVL